MPTGQWEWSAEYEGHEVMVKVDRKGNSELYIDGELRDDTFADKALTIARGEIWLSTEFPDTGDIVDIRFRTGLFSPKVKILVNKKQIGGDSFADSPIEEKVDSAHSEVRKPGILTKLVAFLFIDTAIWFLIGMIFVAFFWEFGDTW